MMKKENKCKECGGSFEKYLCDTCGANLFLGVPITLSFGYGSNLDGSEEYHFCNYKCLLQFTLGELKKENPRTNIEFGKGKIR